MNMRTILTLIFLLILTNQKALAATFPIEDSLYNSLVAYKETKEFTIPIGSGVKVTDSFGKVFKGYLLKVDKNNIVIGSFNKRKHETTTIPIDAIDIVKPVYRRKKTINAITFGAIMGLSVLGLFYVLLTAASLDFFVIAALLSIAAGFGFYGLFIGFLYFLIKEKVQTKSIYKGWKFKPAYNEYTKKRL